MTMFAHVLLVCFLGTISTMMAFCNVRMFAYSSAMCLLKQSKRWAIPSQSFLMSRATRKAFMTALDRASSSARQIKTKLST